MPALEEEIGRRVVEEGFSGVVRVDRGGVEAFVAHGLADRAHGVSNQRDTRFALASGTKEPASSDQ